MHENRKKLLAFIALPMATGVFAGFLNLKNMALYNRLKQPALSPPGWLFPVVWTLLYILMGISSHMISVTPARRKKEALQLYGLQLFINFIWSLVFFRLQLYLLAFLILLLLWYFIYKMLISFWSVNPAAAILQIPYLLWVTFAGFLNLAIVFLN